LPNNDHLDISKRLLKKQVTGILKEQVEYVGTDLCTYILLFFQLFLWF